MSSEPVSSAPPVVLAFAPSDPSGGGGVQADLLTLSSMGCHALTIVTALTVQDTSGIEGVLPIEAEWVADQARCLLEDMPVDAFKIGALASVENIAAVAEILADYPDVPLVLDPTLVAGRGDAQSADAMTHALRDLLLPQTTIATLNDHELRLFAGEDDDADVSTADLAGRLVVDPAADQAHPGLRLAHGWLGAFTTMRPDCRHGPVRTSAAPWIHTQHSSRLSRGTEGTFRPFGPGLRTTPR
jgi:hydroxymethylpyrimidine/phosphomethylpyrimidine kinase